MDSTRSAARAVIPDSFFEKHEVIPLGRDDETVWIGAARPPEDGLVQELAFLTGADVHWEEIERREVDAFFEQSTLSRTDGAPDQTGSTVRSRGGDASVESLDSGSVVQQVERIVHRAIEDGVSDIHFEPYESVFRVRYRVDGVLHTVGQLNRAQRDAVISRLKIMAGLDIAEKRRP